MSDPEVGSTLLAHLVAGRGLAPEPIATDALAHLLGKSLAARQALSSLAEGLCGAPFLETLSYTGQDVGSDELSRPDITGSDSSGVRLVLEAKFDAALTPAQLGSAYLDRLAKGQPGLLGYLVPKDRLAAVWAQLLTGPIGLPSSAPLDLSIQDHEPLTIKIAGGQTVAAFSWPTLLSILDNALVAASDHEARADLRQLAGLVEWRTRTGWVPVVSGDLPPRAGRQLAALRDSVLIAARGATHGKVRFGSTDSGPGRWLKSEGGRDVWVGLWLRVWGTYGISPVWLQVQPSSTAGMKSIEKALESLRLDGGPGLFEYDRTWIVPLIVLGGAEHGAVTASLQSQMSRVLTLLDVANVQTVDVPPEPAESSDVPSEAATEEHS